VLVGQPWSLRRAAGSGPALDLIATSKTEPSFAPGTSDHPRALGFCQVNQGSRRSTRCPDTRRGR